MLRLKRIFVLSGIILAFVSMAGPSWAQVGCKSISRDNAQVIARYIADVIVAGRGIVAKNQNLINDPSKADKGFTPEYLESQIRQSFKEMTGKDVSELSPEARDIVQQVIEAAKLSVQMNQRRINQKGKGFKGYIPAVFGRETGQILKGRCQIFIKQTTFKYRNAYNQPDPFEKKILTMFEDPAYPKGKGYGEFVGSHYRYLQPIYIKQACLKCHGEPKGSIDPAGRKREGYKLGDLRGAISVAFSTN